MKLAIIILNWNGLKDTLECLDSLKASKADSHAVYVVDNASKEPEADVIYKKHTWITVIKKDSNLGFSGGNNVGIKAALKDGAEYIILLNNDTVVDSDIFSNMVNDAQINKFDITSPKIYFYGGREYHSVPKSEQGQIIWYAGGRLDLSNIIATHRGVDEFDHGQYDDAVETDFATGCCMLIHKNVFKSIGFLDDSFLAYYEDNDYCRRAIAKGFKVGYAPSSHLWHKNAGSTGGSGSTTQNTILARSRLRFAIKHAPLRAKLALIRRHYLHNT